MSLSPSTPRREQQHSVLTQLEASSHDSARFAPCRYGEYAGPKHLTEEIHRCTNNPSIFLIKDGKRSRGRSHGTRKPKAETVNFCLYASKKSSNPGAGGWNDDSPNTSDDAA